MDNRIECAGTPASSGKEANPQPAGSHDHASMALREAVDGPARISARMSYAGGAAPSITLASQMERDAEGRCVYREHYEVVLHKKGINLWRMTSLAGQTKWVLAGFSVFLPPQDTVLELGVLVEDWARGGETFGRMITMSLDGRNAFGCLIRDFSGPYRPGITAAEGPCAIHDFSVAAPPAK